VVVPIYFLSNAVFIIMLFSINTSTMASLFDHAMSFAGYNATYTGLAHQAAAAGYTGTQFNLGNTILAAIPWGFLPFTGFNYGAYLAGETKNVKSSIIKALTLAVVISIILIAIMGIMTYVDFGADFVNASSYIQATNPSAFPVLPLATTLISLTNPVVAILIGIGMFAGWITAAVGYIVTLARMVFAASFDSMLPRRFADVSDRWHSPHWAVALVGIASFIYLTVYWNYGWAATLLNTSIVLPIGYGLPLVAAAVFPYMKRDMYQRLFGSMKGALTFTVVALIGAAAFVFYGFAETFPISSGMFLGTNLQLAYEVVLTMLIIGLVIYFTAKLRLSREGIPLASVFQEIPPE
jgi:amino acid transporter